MVSNQGETKFMAIKSVLAGIGVTDSSAANKWYEQLLNRPADANPMPGLAEWHLIETGWLQVFEDKKRAGSTWVTLEVESLDDQLAELKTKGITILRQFSTGHVNIATITDPDGNEINFVQTLPAHNASSESK